MKRLRVGLDVTPLFDRPTGVAELVIGLLGGLAKLDEVEPHGWALSARSLDTTQTGARYAPRPTVHIRRPARVVHEAWARGISVAQRPFADVDVVHGTNFAAPATSRSVISLHDLTLFDDSAVAPAATGRSRLIRRALVEGAHLIAPSAHVRNRAIELLRVEPSRISTIHHGLTSVTAAPGRGRAITGLDAYVLALGTTHRRKNLARLITAMAALPPSIGLVIAGQAGDDEAAVQAGLDGSLGARPVRRIAEVDRETKAGLLTDATALAYPSLDEGFGFPPLEAQLLDVPVAAASAGAIPEIAADGAVYFDPTDTAAIGAGLAEAVDPSNRDRLVAAGRVNIGRFDWAVAAEQTARIYRIVADAAS